MKGILFTELLFNKTVSGEKTQTRREGSFSKINDRPDDFFIGSTCRSLNLHTPHGALEYLRMGENGRGIIHNTSDDAIKLTPRYKVGEVCYLKEPYYLIENHFIKNPRLKTFYKYGVDNDTIINPIGITFKKTGNEKFSNKLFMPQSSARYYIKITDVKAERLFDISAEDCIKEGVDYDTDYDRDSMGSIDLTTYKDYQGNPWTMDHLESYLSLFRFANKIPKSKKIENIWCWVYDYVLCDKYGTEL